MGWLLKDATQTMLVRMHSHSACIPSLPAAWVHSMYELTEEPLYIAATLALGNDIMHGQNTGGVAALQGFGYYGSLCGYVQYGSELLANIIADAVVHDQGRPLRGFFFL